MNGYTVIKLYDSYLDCLHWPMLGSRLETVGQGTAVGCAGVLTAVRFLMLSSLTNSRQGPGSAKKQDT